MAALGGREFQPACGEDPGEVSVGHDQHVVQAGFQDPGHNLVRACCHFVQGFAVGHTVRPDQVVGVVLADQVRADALIVAVVPFHGQRLMLRVRESCQLGRPPGAAQRGGQDQVEVHLVQHLAGFHSLLLALHGQRQVGEPCVLPALGPFGLTVAQDPELGAGCNHRNSHLDSSFGESSTAAGGSCAPGTTGAASGCPAHQASSLASASSGFSGPCSMRSSRRNL